MTMIPSASEVVRRRWTVSIVLRFVSVVLVLCSLSPLVSWLVEGISDNDLWDVSWYADRIFGFAVLFFGAIAIYFLAGIMSRWLVPVRRVIECPGCKHRIEGLVEPRCTECGLLLTHEFLSEESRMVKPGTSLGAGRVILMRETAAGVFRVAGVFAAMLGLLWGAASLVGFAYWFIDGEAGDFGYFISMLSYAFQTTVWLGFAGVMLFAPRRLAAFCIPLQLGAPTTEVTTPDPLVSGSVLDPP